MQRDKAPDTFGYSDQLERCRVTTVSDPTPLVRARWLLNVRGFSVIPLDHPAAPVATDPRQIGKVPVEKWEMYQHRLADEDTLERWFGNGRPRNIGIITGKVSGIVVVDLDNAEAVAWARENLPDTPIRTRTAKGEHLFYRHPGVPVPNKARVQTEDGRLKLDVRGDGGYVVSPGAQHATGVRYKILGDWKTPLEKLPVFDLAWIAPAAKSPETRPSSTLTPRPGVDAVTRARAYLEAMGPAIEGQGGDQHTFRAAGVLVNDFALDAGTALNLLRDWNHGCVPPWEDDELDAKVRNARRYGSHQTGAKLEQPRPIEARRTPSMGDREPASDVPDDAEIDSSAPSDPARDFALTDSGNAEYFAALYGKDLRYDHRRARWLVWTGHRYQPDVDAAVYRRAKAAIRRRLQDASRLEDSEARARLAKWAISSESRGRLDALIYLARAEYPIADAGDRWDSHTMLLGVPNGTVELRVGALRPGRREDRITMCTSVPFIADATCPRWEQFLSEIFAHDAALVEYVQKVMGYSLTGDTSEQLLVLGHGIGSNGKGTLYNTFSDMLGDYSYSMPFSTIEMQQRAAIPNDLAALDGRRYVTASETNDGTRLNESRIKALTGCDPITARFLHGEFFTFRPQAKFWLAVNHKPIVRDDSYGFWRRIRLVPFTETFPVTPGLAVALRAEYPGILAWAVRGCLAWQREGLTPPAAVVKATEIFETDSDVVSGFLNEATERDAGAEVRAAELFAHYKQWALQHGFTDRERLGPAAFGRKMAERFTRVKKSHGYVYQGVSRLEIVTGSDQ